jgi:DNA primase large subunit
MIFWKSEFTKKISAEKFEKEYAYNIRHMYGKEGNKKDYDPKSCAKIILGNAGGIFINLGSGDHHGCPFKNFDVNNLGLLLKKMGID